MQAHNRCAPVQNICLSPLFGMLDNRHCTCNSNVYTYCVMFTAQWTPEPFVKRRVEEELVNQVESLARVHKLID